MGLLSSKQKNHESLVKTQGEMNGGNWKTKTKHYDPDLDVGNMLRRLASINNYHSQGGAYSDYNPNDLDDMDMNVDTIEEYRPKQQRHLKYEKDILALLNGGNVPDTDVDMNVDIDLDQVNKKVNYDEGCGCSGDRIIYGGKKHWSDIDEGCGCSSDRIMYGGKKHWSDMNVVDDDDEDDDNDEAFEMLSRMLQTGGKRRDDTSINLSSTVLSSSVASPINISSTTSVGYKSSSNELNIMPFYSTPDSNTTSIGGYSNKSALSSTSTLHSSTSTISSSLKQYNVSTTSDNYISRPVSKKRY